MCDRSWIRYGAGGILLLDRVLRECMSATITPPRERECELCGREERWDDDADGWRIEDEPGMSTASTSGTSTDRSPR